MSKPIFHLSGRVPVGRILLGVIWVSIATGNLAAQTNSGNSGNQSAADHTIVCEGKYKHHLQGICSDKACIYWCFTTTLVKTNLKGQLIKKIPVANHHGDLCFHQGKLYVAVNLGKFNDPNGNADSWVYVYDAQTLKEISRHQVEQVFHGAGGIGIANGHFFLVGGLPDKVSENYVYEYDAQFKFIRKHIVKSGHTHLGIQTATFSKGHWYFGCYGNPAILIVTDRKFLNVKRYEFNCSLGIESLPDGQLFAATGKCDKKTGCGGELIKVTPHAKKGLVPSSEASSK